ncbi:RHS repeat-associated core domain-containing protein, partial [Neisseria sp. HMSC066B07]|uniref:RHS repeat domain-containing protein n=1 Tax=Neisseria sp. HMSC066B07 TaxID=1739476 RepID=UPI000ACA4267
AEIKKPAGNTEIWTYAYDPFGRRLSKERQDKLAWTSTDPKRTHFVWDGTRLLQEYTYKGCYTYIYTDQDSYDPLAQIFDNAKDGKQYLAYFHNDQIGIPREMTDIHGNLLWYGEYTAWGRLKKDERVYKDAHQPFRLQNQYFDEETGLHYNLMRYYEPEAGRFVNQDPIGLTGGSNLYQFSLNSLTWIDPLGLKVKMGKHDRLRKIRDGKQSHHLNQDNAFDSIIPRGDAAAIKLLGNALRDIGSDHYQIHYVMERFWDQFRKTGVKRKSGKKYLAGITRPTVGQYNKMLKNALAATSLSPKEQCKALSSAKRSQAKHGIKEDDLVPNIPRTLGQKK